MATTLFKEIKEPLRALQVGRGLKWPNFASESEKKDHYSCTNWYKLLPVNSVFEACLCLTDIKGELIVPSHKSMFGEGCCFSFEKAAFKKRWFEHYFIISRKSLEIPSRKLNLQALVKGSTNNPTVWGRVSCFKPPPSTGLAHCVQQKPWTENIKTAGLHNRSEIYRHRTINMCNILYISQQTALTVLGYIQPSVQALRDNIFRRHSWKY